MTDPGDPVITSTDAQIADWLARAHKASAVAAREWTSDLVAMLPLGTRFDAVRIRPEVVQAAAGSDDWRGRSQSSSPTPSTAP